MSNMIHSQIMELHLDSRLSPDTAVEFPHRSSSTQTRGEVRSACTSPATQCLPPELPTITVSDSQLLASVSHSEDGGPEPEPSLRRSRLERMVSDVMKLGKLIRHNRVHYRSGSSSVVGSFSNGSSPSRESLSSHDGSISPESRRIRVEHQDVKSHSRQSIHSDVESTDEWSTPDHNFSSSLMITSLQDGNFSAEISLKQFPMDDLVLVVSGHELEIIVDKSSQHHHKKKKHRVSVPYHYGVVDLPIFVDPSSLVFAKDSERNILILQGNTKGSFTRRRSVSFDSLPTFGGTRKDAPGAAWRKLVRKLGVRRSKSHGTIVKELKHTENDM